jgi:hypothetical protein
MSERVFPLGRPESGEDARFNFGLLHDVMTVLEQHGYLAREDWCGRDLVELRQALFRFLYGPTDTTGGGEV